MPGVVNGYPLYNLCSELVLWTPPPPRGPGEKDVLHLIKALRFRKNQLIGCAIAQLISLGEKTITAQLMKNIATDEPSNPLVFVAGQEKRTILPHVPKIDGRGTSHIPQDTPMFLPKTRRHLPPRTT